MTTETTHRDAAVAPVVFSHADADKPPVQPPTESGTTQVPQFSAGIPRPRP